MKELIFKRQFELEEIYKGEASDGTMESSDDTGGQPCHQCQSNNRDRGIWCLRCYKRAYCENCISTCYLECLKDVQRVCPACRGTCSSRVCMRGDNLIKATIREIPAKDKLQYLYSFLSALLPIVKKIHYIQCSEVKLEKMLEGNERDLVRIKLNADEEMCWWVAKLVKNVEEIGLQKNFCCIRGPISSINSHCLRSSVPNGVY